MPGLSGPSAMLILLSLSSLCLTYQVSTVTKQVAQIQTHGLLPELFSLDLPLSLFLFKRSFHVFSEAQTPHKQVGS